jgi:hypothetical protein
MPNLVGRRYRCNTCQSEFIVTKRGDGRLECHDEPMELVGPGSPGGETSNREPKRSGGHDGPGDGS